MSRQRSGHEWLIVLCCVQLLLFVGPIAAQPAADRESPPSRDESQQSGQRVSAERQNELDAAFIKMLSGATLEGTFTSTAPESDPTKLSPEKYTLGEVTKIAGNIWLIPARIEYGDHDVTLPITVPVKWAGDTPVIVVDNVGLPGFGTVSARVMFFADHYAGYWRHGEHGGHLFGTIRRNAAPDKPVTPGVEDAKPSNGAESTDDSSAD